MATKRTPAKRTTKVEKTAVKKTARKTTAKNTSVYWFGGVPTSYEGSDPWLVVRFAEPVSPTLQRRLTRLLGSDLGKSGQQTWTGRDLELDFTGLFDADVDVYAGGYRQLIRDVQAAMKAMNDLHPILVVFFIPDETERALDDETVLAYQRRPLEAALRLATGTTAQRLIAAKSVYQMLTEHRSVAEKLLTDVSLEVAKVAKESVAQHIRYWAFRKDEPYERCLELFRRIASPAIADAARTIDGPIVRDYVQGKEANTRPLIDAMSDPIAGPFLRAIVAEWEVAPRAFWEDTIPHLAQAAIWVARVQEDWPKVEALTTRALEIASDPGLTRLPSGQAGHEAEVAKVLALRDRALAAQGKPAQHRPSSPEGKAPTVPLASCRPNETVTVIARVASLGEPRVVEKRGNDLVLRDGVLEDESGQLHITLWGDDCDAVKVGDLVRVDEGWVKKDYLTGEPNLSLGRSGRLTVLSAS